MLGDAEHSGTQRYRETSSMPVSPEELSTELNILLAKIKMYGKLAFRNI